MENVYFETSAFNYLLNAISPDALFNTRELQTKKGRCLYVSPITLWEVMLAGEKSDYFVYFAQNIFSEKLLATPSELLTRYLLNDYLNNSVSYSIFTDAAIGDLWLKMASDSSIKFDYNHEDLITKTSFIRGISNKIHQIVQYPDSKLTDKYHDHIANVIHTYYECLLEDGFFPELDDAKYNKKIFYKTFLLFTFGLLLFKFDIYNQPVDDFWKRIDFEGKNLTEKISAFFEKYPLIFKRGPLLEITMMAYHQLQLGRNNRGLILDSFHMVYAPYMDTIITADDDFIELKRLEKHYNKKLHHIEEMHLNVVPFLSKKKKV